MYKIKQVSDGQDKIRAVSSHQFHTEITEPISCEIVVLFLKIHQTNALHFLLPNILVPLSSQACTVQSKQYKST